MRRTSNSRARCLAPSASIARRPSSLINAAAARTKPVSIACRDEQSALPVLDYFRQAANCEGNRWDAERHGVDYRCAKSFRARRVPKNIEPGNGLVDLLDESGVEPLDT
jgi:hypothetical protein